jgi:4-hydroxy-tetrahydrodipicolinate synthase
VMIQDAQVTVAPSHMVRLAEVYPNLCYVKEEAADAGHRISEIVRLRPAMRILSGGSYLLDDLARGAQGAIPGSIGVADLSCAYERYMAGDLAGARAAYDHFTPLSFYRRQFPLLASKEVLRRLGVFKAARLREPSNECMDEQDQRELSAIMEHMGPPY